MAERRALRRTRRNAGAFFSIVGLVPALVLAGYRYVPHEFSKGDSLLSPSLRIVDPSLERADALARPFRESGIEVVTYAPDALRDPAALTKGSVWWVTERTADTISPALITSMADAGARVMLDGDSPVARKLFNIRPFEPSDEQRARAKRKAAARALSRKQANVAPEPNVITKRKSSTFTRRGEMNGQTLQWSVDVPVVAASGTPLAVTELESPALVAKGSKLLWSAVPLSKAEDPTQVPYLAQVLARRWGVTPRAERGGFDLFVDLDVEANRKPSSMIAEWKRAGFTRLFVPAWKRDVLSGWRFDYRPLISEAHKHGVEVWAWLEWPHVANGFLKQHPECQERTGDGKIASNDWREYVALTVDRCFDLAWKESQSILGAASFDGVNIADLRFESMFFGHTEAKYYTPFHPAVRKDFEKKFGWDPVEIVRNGSKSGHRNSSALRDWQQYREDELTRVYEKLLTKLHEIPQGKKLAVTLVDDRSVASASFVKANSGQSSKRIAALQRSHDFEIIVRDPLWFRDLDPETTSAAFGPKAGLGVSAVDRPQPFDGLLRRPGGFGLSTAMSRASSTGARVAIYGTGRMRPDDLGWLRFAAATDVVVHERGGVVETSSNKPFRLRLAKRARHIYVDGLLAGKGDVVEIGAGTHEVRVSS